MHKNIGFFGINYRFQYFSNYQMCDILKCEINIPISPPPKARNYKERQIWNTTIP